MHNHPALHHLWQFQHLIALLLLGCATIAVYSHGSDAAFVFACAAASNLLVGYLITRQPVNHLKRAALAGNESIALQSTLQQIAARLAQAAVSSVLLITCAALLDTTNETTWLGLALSIGAAAIPTTLAVILQAQLLFAPKKHFLQNLRSSVRAALTSMAGKLLLILASYTALAWWQITPVVRPVQLLAVDLVLCLPIIALAWDRPPTKVLTSHFNKLVSLRSVKGYVAFGGLAAALSYVNFLFFFSRHNLGADHLDPSLPLYQQATTLAMVSLVGCLAAYVFFERSSHREHFFSDYLNSNRTLLYAFGADLVVIVNIVYNPLLKPLFDTAPLDPIDWLTAILVTGFFSLGCLLQRHTRQHSRNSILKLHQNTPDVLASYLKKIKL
jgi:magnesium-transporting ATPase (P-type)